VRTLVFAFADLEVELHHRPDDTVHPHDLVASRFGVRVDGEVLFDEGAFPLVELAIELDEWLTYGLPRDGDLDYEVTGGEPGTLTIRRVPVGWLVDSGLRDGGRPAPGPLPEAAVVAGVRGFVDELAAETARAHGLDLRALLREVAEARATDIGARRRRRDLWVRQAHVGRRGMERGALIDLVGRIMRAEGADEAEVDRLIDDFEDQVLMPGASALIFYPDGHFDHEPSAEEIVAKALSYRPIQL
jgi:hypothetical protein